MPMYIYRFCKLYRSVGPQHSLTKQSSTGGRSISVLCFIHSFMHISFISGKWSARSNEGIVIYHSVASRLRSCGNPAKYIYRPHKLKASTSVHLQKMRTGCIFQQPVQPFFLFFLVSTITRCSLCDFLS